LPRKYVLAAAGLAVLLLCSCFGLARTGILGPDEARYADVGRAMAVSGDWITPRLWGSPWFEKPALLYWMTALGFRAGLDQDLAPRLPVALLSVGFVLFFAWILRREFGGRAAFYSAAMLATSALWLGFSHVAVFDLPLSATFGACMLLVMSDRRTRPQMAVAGALLGAAMLSKGFVPCVLFLPALWRLRRDWRQIALIAVTAALVAAPWYALVTARNGQPFIDDFFWKQQFSRLSSPDLQHVQPFWFYLPVMLAGFFPWTPLVFGFWRDRSLIRDPRVQFLLAWLLWGLVFFSASLNKLPGYVLPLFPALAALTGILSSVGQDGIPRRLGKPPQILVNSPPQVNNLPHLLAFSAAWVWLFPIAGQMLPAILLHGFLGVSFNVSPLWILPALASGTLVWWLAARGRPHWAVAVIGGVATLCVVEIVLQIYPALDRSVSARQYWMQHPALNCSPETNRAWRYSLNYYASQNLPSCQSPVNR
jgi:4-amino-4-deoxy-L-arabinose transferase-like glycosyltransferase